MAVPFWLDGVGGSRDLLMAYSFLVGVAIIAMDRLTVAVAELVFIARSQISSFSSVKCARGIVFHDRIHFY